MCGYERKQRFNYDTIGREETPIVITTLLENKHTEDEVLALFRSAPSYNEVQDWLAKAQKAGSGEYAPQGEKGCKLVLQRGQLKIIQPK